MEKLRKQIIQLINESRLPAEGVYYIFKDVFRDIEDSYKDYLVRQEQEESKIKESKEETE